MNTTTTPPPDLAPEVPPAPSTFQFSLPDELVSNVLRHLDPHALRLAAFVSKQWYSAAFPIIHRAFWPYEWGPRIIALYKRQLQAFPHIAAAIRHLEAPRTWDEESWKQDWIEGKLEFEWGEAHPDVPYQYFLTDPTDPVAAFFARMAREALEEKAEEMFEMEDGKNWMRNSPKRSEVAVFEFIRWLPALKTVSFWCYEARVKFDYLKDARLSSIEKVELHACSSRFVASLRNHWRFSRAEFIIS